MLRNYLYFLHPMLKPAFFTFNVKKKFDVDKNSRQPF
jgi:hypothetical protein